MEINVLAVNVGNSRLALGVFVAGSLDYVARLALEQRSDWESSLNVAWQRIAEREQPAVVVASVNPGVDGELGEVLARITQREAQWVGRQIPLPIRVCTDSPQQTGVDRILNVAAAYEQMQKACVVVDAGTAITVDCCNDQGDFLGGAISPGLRMMLRSLHQGTACLPLVDFHVPEGLLGRNTEQAILQGVYYGIRGMVRELAENYATHLGRWPEIIATGGDAKLLFEGWELLHAVAPDLGLYGTALAYANVCEAGED